MPSASSSATVSRSSSDLSRSACRPPSPGTCRRWSTASRKRTASGGAARRRAPPGGGHQRGAPGRPRRAPHPRRRRPEHGGREPGSRRRLEERTGVSPRRERRATSPSGPWNRTFPPISAGRPGGWGRRCRRRTTRCGRLREDLPPASTVLRARGQRRAASREWSVINGRRRRPSTHRLQATAVRAAMRTAKRRQVDLVIHARDGRFRCSKNSYGNESPRRDWKHDTEDTPGAGPRPRCSNLHRV